MKKIKRDVTESCVLNYSLYVVFVGQTTKNTEWIDDDNIKKFRASHDYLIAY